MLTLCLDTTFDTHAKKKLLSRDCSVVQGLAGTFACNYQEERSNKQTNNQTNERTNEQTNEPTNERTNKQTNKQTQKLNMTSLNTL